MYCIFFNCSIYSQVPLGAGIALAHQYRGNGQICITLYGDGAANQGQVRNSHVPTVTVVSVVALWLVQWLKCYSVVQNSRSKGSRVKHFSGSLVAFLPKMPYSYTAFVFQGV